MSAEAPQKNLEQSRRPVVVERYGPMDRSAVERLGDRIGQVADDTVTIFGLTAILLPFFILAALNLDIPARMFDHWAQMKSLEPSQWFSVGDVFFSLSIFVLVLMSRRHGSYFAIRAWILAWVILSLLSGLMFLYLAPSLEAGDLPKLRYGLGVVMSWGIAGIVGGQLFDLLRGSRWWRPPFFSAFIALAVQAMLYMLLVYAGSEAPVFVWLLAQLILAATASVVFLPIYALMKGHIKPTNRPMSGLGR